MRCLLLSTFLIAPRLATADVFFDGSMGPSGPAPTRATSGFTTDYLVIYDESIAEPARQGERRGPNLFQSLDRIDLDQGQRATFQALDAQGQPLTGLQRVITRVTNRQRSTIGGVLRSEIPGADFFLLNPAGISFLGAEGSQLQLDMPADFTASTADYLRFEDPLDLEGTVFDVLDLENFSLSAEPVESFGFLGRNRGEVRFDFSQPELLPGERFQVVAGDVVATNDTIVRMPGGVVEMAAVGGAAVEVPLDVAAWRTRGAAKDVHGDIVVDAFTEMRTNDGLPASGAGGRIVLRGGRLVVDDARIQAAGNAGPDELALDLEFTDEIDARNFSRVQTSGTRIGGIGAARLSAARVRVRDNDTFVGSRPTLSGGGTFTVEADEVEVSGIAVLGTEGQFGPGGKLRVEARTVSVANGGAIGTNVSGAGQPGGNVEVLAEDLLLVGEGGAIRSDNVITVLGVPRPGGRGGDLDLEAGRVLLSPGARIQALSGPQGDGGNIVIRAGTLEIGSAAQVLAGTVGDRDAGDVTVVARERIDIRGDDPAVPAGIFARSGDLVGGTIIAGTGDGGNIRLGGPEGTSAPAVSLTGSAVISARSRGAGNAGNVSVMATQLSLTGDETGAAEISARAQDGDTAGSITIVADEVVLEGGAAIAASTTGRAPGGRIDVDADTLAIQGVQPGAETSSAILSDTTFIENDAGDAGIIDLALREKLLVTDGGEIRAVTRGAGNAGSIAIRVGVSEGDAGSIDIAADSKVRVGAGGNISAAALAGSSGEAGDVSIVASKIALDGGSVTTEARDGTATGGDVGGNISFTAGSGIRLSGGSLVSARSVGTQDAGRIEIDAGRRLRVEGSQITTEATEETANAAGGQIEIRAKERVDLVRSEISTSVRASIGNEDGGDIAIDPRFVVVNQSEIFAEAIFGDGGNITIVADNYLESADSVVSASSALGIDGFVDTNPPDTELMDELTQLPARFLEATHLLREHCAARVAGRGSFVVTGREGRAAAPDRPLSAQIPLPDDAPARDATVWLRALETPPSEPLLGLALRGCEAVGPP